MASLGPKEIYLILYNSVCCYGWALVLLGAIKTLIGGDGSLGENLSNVYAPVADMLTYAQTAALMEIVHAGVGLVRSPVVVTAMQVSSRIFALVAIVYAPSAQGELRHVMLLYQVIYDERENQQTYPQPIYSSMGRWIDDFVLVHGRSSSLRLLRCCLDHWRCHKGNPLSSLLAPLLSLCCLVPHWYYWRAIRLLLCR